MAETVRVNLGCGSTYKPGYINVDRYDGSVADVLADVASLPYASDSVDLIEASQLIEHFDSVHSKYVLAEWFRVLKPGGELVLETPDLLRSFRRLLKSRDKEREDSIQWVFGIDSPGLRHKTGFTFDHLRQVLELTGFCEVSNEKQRTHVYEPGMRISCRKQEHPDGKMFLACFRKRLVNRLGTPDSYVLIPLEDCIGKVHSMPEDLADRDTRHGLISVLAVNNPLIPLTLLDEAVASDILSEGDISDERAFLRELVDMRFHERVFELWVRSRKGPKFGEEFASFVSRAQSLIRDCLRYPDQRMERLEYIRTLDPRATPLFDANLIVQAAQRSFGAGMRAFSTNDLPTAKSQLSESLRINPQNPLAHWNLARICAIAGESPETVIGHYKDAVNQITDAGWRKRVQSELDRFPNARVDVADLAPISEV